MGGVVNTIRPQNRLISFMGNGGRALYFAEGAGNSILLEPTAYCLPGTPMYGTVCLTAVVVIRRFCYSCVQHGPASIAKWALNYSHLECEEQGSR